MRNAPLTDARPACSAACASSSDCDARWQYTRYIWPSSVSLSLRVERSNGRVRNATEFSSDKYWL
ncbi:hypothetical protein A6V36_33795 [Paraburkholderia ginsengiterrae]|uniref:Uncharacterized protein n=1 Tax=Paraburkholderia ginsengiterrae TaxID=1462993 RepID=A0A1A9N8V9_9BURK|nr:hypothetical protein A6V36_33795 [Paraburkholderia ginsengiterrae]OAJ61621.1 hypothetical protein A6V37_25065 [Paraburkholderia ginsengiterrae]